LQAYHQIIQKVATTKVQPRYRILDHCLPVCAQLNVRVPVGLVQHAHTTLEIYQTHRLACVAPLFAQQQMGYFVRPHPTDVPKVKFAQPVMVPQSTLQPALVVPTNVIRQAGYFVYLWQINVIPSECAR